MLQNIPNKFFSFIEKNMLFIYTTALAFQIIYVCFILLNTVVPLPSYHYHKGVVLLYNKYKRVELLQYMLGATVIGILFSFVFFNKDLKINVLQNRAKELNDTLNQMQNNFARWLYLLSVLLLPLWFLISPSSFNKTFTYATHIPKRYLYIAVIIIGYAQLVSLFYGTFTNPPKVISEYFDIPNTTLLDNKKTINDSIIFQRLLNKVDSHYFSEHIDISKVEDEWLSDNAMEKKWQIYSRGVIHHHGYVFNPINELALGKNKEKVITQYGLGSATIFETFFSSIGGTTLQGWFRLNGLFYCLYFILFILITYQLTNKSLGWTSAVFITSLIFINKRDYEFIFIAPGDSPWRHFLDLFIVYAIFLYAKKNKFIYYFLSLVLGLVSVYINPQMGFMIFISTIVVGIFYAIKNKVFITATLVSIILFIPMALYVYYTYSFAGDLGSYYIDGVIGSEVSYHNIFFILAILLVFYIALTRLVFQKDSRDYLPLIFLFTYSQLLIVYMIWHFDYNGKTARSFIYILSVFLLLFLSTSHTSLPARYRKYISGIFFIIIAVAYIDSVVHLEESRYNYNKTFKSHVTYKWNFKKAKIISTVNPIYFENSLKLIQKHNTGKGIYIISEYDNIIPFLADKYSLMPFFDMKWYNITKKEVNKSVRVLLEKKPEYIFVDNKYNLSQADYVIIPPDFPKLGFLHVESRFRAERMQILYSIFKAIEKDYHLQEKGLIMSVYKRNDS